MATTKTRINLSVPRDTEEVLEFLAKKEGIPVARKTLDIVQDWLELQEDSALARSAEERLKQGGKYLTHEQVWKRFHV